MARYIAHSTRILRRVITRGAWQRSAARKSALSLENISASQQHRLAANARIGIGSGAMSAAGSVG